MSVGGDLCSLLLLSLPLAGVSLSCLKCHERVGGVSCRDGVVQNCEELFPSQAVVCSKTVWFRADGERLVNGNCQAERHVQDGGLGVCLKETNATLLTEEIEEIHYCTCSGTDLCNRAPATLAPLPFVLMTAALTRLVKLWII